MLFQVVGALSNVDPLIKSEVDTPHARSDLPKFTHSE